MADLIIACLSQKGGVGKSTMSRLIATAYAAHDMRVGIADFNPNQKTAIQWAEMRAANGITPQIDAFPGTQANRLRTNRSYDLIVVDGKPDSAPITLSIAEVADLVVIPTSTTLDDLTAQRGFARDLVKAGIPVERLLFVLNQHFDNPSMIRDAISFLADEFKIAQNTIPYRASFARCQDNGLSIGEIRKSGLGNVAALATTAEALALEIATIVQEA